MSAMPAEVDVLVVGYGPVGAALATLLGRYGTRVLVIDKAPDILMAPRAIALDNEALRILQMVGLAADAFATCVIPEVRMRSPLVGEFGRVNTRGCIDGHPKLVTFYQPELERALRQEAARHASLTALTGVELLTHEPQADGIQALLRDAEGSEHRVRARFLVGADGAASSVRNAIGQDFEGKTYAEDWLIIDALGMPVAFDHVEFICDPRRPTPHMVAPGGRMRWEFMLQPGETRAEMERADTIASLLAPWGPPADLRIERKAVYRFHARSCQRYSVGPVFLAGDAAHITPPFVGQGLVAGLRDAANLAWKLAWVVRGHAAPRILDSYDRERRPHAVKMIALAKLMGQLVMPRNRAMALLVHGSMRLLRLLPPLRRQLEELGVKPKNEFGSGLFQRGRSRLRRGAQLPQVRVRTPHGEVRLSDDVLGDALSLVCFGPVARPGLPPALVERWQAHGGRFVDFDLDAAAAEHREGHVDLDGGLRAAGAIAGWCAVLRPDRVVLHDGPVTQAAHLLEETLALLEASVPQAKPLAAKPA